MIIRNIIVAILLAAASVAVFLLLTAALAVGQTTTRAPVPPIATAQIPFDFWIGDTRLPAGDYALYPVMRLSTVVLVRNTKTNEQEQAFLLPAGTSVAVADPKLVFVTRNGQHYLSEVWRAEGESVLTSQIGVGARPADARSEVPLVAVSPAAALSAKD